MPNFKLIHQAMIPIMGSWIDAAHFGIMLFLLSLGGAVLLFAPKPWRFRPWVQMASFILFIAILHRCLCAVRGRFTALRPSAARKSQPLETCA